MACRTSLSSDVLGVVACIAAGLIIAGSVEFNEKGRDVKKTGCNVSGRLTSGNLKGEAWSCVRFDWSDSGDNGVLVRVNCIERIGVD